MRVTEMGASEGCPVIGQTEVASPQGDNITSPETELTSYWCSSSRTLEEPMYEAKQMTTGQPVGAASDTTGGFFFPPPRESAASQYRVGLLRFESGRVLVFQGGVFGCSSRMTGNLQVRFLEGWAPAMAPGHSTVIRAGLSGLVMGSRLGFSEESAVATWRCGRQLQRISSEHL